MRIKDFNYDLFDSFLGTFIKGPHKSFVLAKANNNDTVSKESLEKLYDIFVKAKQKMDKEEETREKFDDVAKSVKPEDIRVLNHAVWLWGFPNNRKPQWVLASNEKKEDQKKYRQMDSCSVAGAGSGYVQYKVKGIRFILYVLSQIFDSESIDKAKERIVEICKPTKASTSEVSGLEDSNNLLTYDPKRNESMPDGVRNLLLHLCYPDKYEPIATTADKRRIVAAFNGAGDDLDEAIKKIRVEDTLVKDVLKDGDTFYSHSLPLLWKGESNGDSLSRAQLLEYKKAMVLYGPPGTGKTYTAIELAKEILLRETMRRQKEKKKTILKIEEILAATDETIQSGSDLSNYIYYLQLHINYNYEDFIAGQVIDQSKGVITKKGFIFDIIEKANNNKEMPYIVILDEMNRVDVSRVFGELFTAIEKRNTDVFLTLQDPDNKDKRLVLNVPDNIYFIGTMNEIDFSLEQLDFALRRRFIWELVDYSEDTLETIIRRKIEKDKDEENDNLTRFLKNCTEVNRYIASSLGKEYNIGHAFFAEIATLYNNLKENNINGNNWNQARKMLWQISILPTIEAYCGSMDRDEKKKFINECRNTYYGN